MKKGKINFLICLNYVYQKRMFYDICNYQLGSKCNTISLVTVLLEKMNITPDSFIVWQNGFFKINDTILFTWILMAVIISVSVFF